MPGSAPTAGRAPCGQPRNQHLGLCPPRFDATRPPLEKGFGPLPVERFIKSFEIEMLLQYYANSTQQRINLRCPCAAAYPSCRTQQCACKKEYVMHYYGSQYIEDISALLAPEHPIHRTLTKC